MCAATPSTQAKQSSPVFYLPVHPAQRVVSLAPSVSGTPGVDSVLCSQQPEVWEPIPALPEIVPLQGIFTAPPGILPSVAAAEIRARLTDGDKLQLDEKSSGNAHADTDMNQALYLWCTWVERADATKDSVRAAATSAKDVQVRKTKMDQENMLLPQSKKRIFVEAAAALGDETDDEDTGWMGSEQGEPVPMTKGQEAQLRRDKKRKLKDRKENLDKIYTMKEQDMTSVVKDLAEYLMNREAPHSQAASLAVSGSATYNKNEVREVWEEVRGTNTKVEGLQLSTDENSRKLDLLLSLMQPHKPPGPV
ncbi:hypothetical protein K440DRAFT_635725 [Wilcoxina mikolae CBS 423.85]|nr:hypothetical protein K440DRAFT_635725 [Wilcoxina mikolae CBS 423.85]